MLDVEWNGQSVNCPKKVPREQALAKIEVMLREMEAHTGKRPIIYTDITFHKDMLEGEFNDYPYWIRSIAAEPQRALQQPPLDLLAVHHHRPRPRRQRRRRPQRLLRHREPVAHVRPERLRPAGPRPPQAVGVCRDMDAVQTASIDE